MLKYRKNGCMFCNPINTVTSLELAIAVPARVPISPTHIQILPKRHTNTFNDLIAAESHHCIELIKMVISNIPNQDSNKFRVNFNTNESQGHFHIDVIANT